MIILCFKLLTIGWKLWDPSNDEEVNEKCLLINKHFEKHLVWVVRLKFE